MTKWRGRWRKRRAGCGMRRQRWPEAALRLDFLGEGWNQGSRKWVAWSINKCRQLLALVYGHISCTSSRLPSVLVMPAGPSLPPNPLTGKTTNTDETIPPLRSPVNYFSPTE